MMIQLDAAVTARWLHVSLAEAVYRHKQTKLSLGFRHVEPPARLAITLGQFLTDLAVGICQFGAEPDKIAN
jgi:hypothetical protein